jgi:hypothetical protein
VENLFLAALDINMAKRLQMAIDEGKKNTDCKVFCVR